jgi:uncharacterized protein (TIGR02996 family)
VHPEDTFWRAIAHQPDDDLPKLVFADWLDKRGDRRGACLRWMVKHGVRPIHDTTDNTWDWWSRPPREPDYYPEGDVLKSILLNDLFVRLKGKPTDVWKGYESYYAAVKDLCTAWVAAGPHNEELYRANDGSRD